MTTCLITGVAGFIGSALGHAVLAQGEQVRGLDNFSTGKRENLDALLPRIDFHEMDLSNVDALRKMCRGVDYILHQAAVPSVPRSVVDPISCNEDNLDGTLNLLIAARDAKVKRIVFAASSAAYGDTPSLPKHEDMSPNPISPYAVAKLACEYYLLSFYRCYGMETVSLRYFNVFGPRQDPTSQYSGVLAKFITSMLRGEAPTIFGDGTQSRDFTYVDNVVQANLLAAKAPADEVAGKTFNIANGQRVDLNETAKILKKITGYSGVIKYEEERAADIKHSLADISRAQKHFGYDPQIGFEEGLRRTVEWYRSQGLWRAA